MLVGDGSKIGRVITGQLGWLLYELWRLFVNFSSNESSELMQQLYASTSPQALFFF